MKPSGIEWIGDIPADWEVRRLKGLGEQTIGLTYSPQDITDNSGTLVLRSSNIQNGKLVLDRDDNVYVSIDVENKILKDEDILICSRNGSRNLVGKTAFVITYGKKLSYGAFTTIFRSKYNKFLFYVFNAGVFEYHLASYNTSTINQLTTSMLNEIRVPFPPVKTQQKIADYLDEKCGEIDATIAKQKESIEKLKAYKQSLISETVTKGLEKSAPIKPSGIVCLGDIPNDWENFLLNRCLTIQNGLDYKSVRDDNGEFPVIGSGGQFDFASNYLYDGESVLFGRKGTINKPLYVNGKFWTVDTMFYSMIKPNACGKFIFYSATTIPFDFYSTATAVPSMTQRDLINHYLVLPPLSKQRIIADYLDSKCSQIDKYITEKQNIIQKLDAYKKSLIFECVTGKHKI